jgi:hypothetical protein
VSVRGRWILPALLLAVAVAVAGCGSTKTSSPTTSTTAPPTATTTAPPEGTMPLTVYKIRDGKLVPTTVHVKQTQAVASAALAALGLPAKVSLAPGGTAVVELAHVTPAEAAEIVFTLTQFPAVQQVDIGPRHGLTRADVGSFAPLILVEVPAAGASVGPQIRILGTAEVFEATLVVQLVQRGKVVEEKTVTASAGAPQRGVFTAELNATEAGPATIVAYAPSAEDGSHQHEVRIPVTVAP